MLCSGHKSVSPALAGVAGIGAAIMTPREQRMPWPLTLPRCSSCWWCRVGLTCALANPSPMQVLGFQAPVLSLDIDKSSGISGFAEVEAGSSITVNTSVVACPNFGCTPGNISIAVRAWVHKRSCMRCWQAGGPRLLSRLSIRVDVRLLSSASLQLVSLSQTLPTPNAAIL